MLEYALTKEFIVFLASLNNKERGEMLWESQGFLSHCPGYLRHKTEDLDDIASIYTFKGDFFYKTKDAFNERIIVDAKRKGEESSLLNSKGEVAVKESIVSLLKEDKGHHYQDDLAKFLAANYFTNWFVRLLDELEPEDRALFARKPVVATASTAPIAPVQPPVVKPIEKAISPVVQPKTVAPVAKPMPKATPSTPKQDVNGAEYEKAILAELQMAYEKRQAAKKKTASAPLHHVKFAPKEEVISYKNENECLDLLLKRTRKFGCHNSSNDWLIILANTVDDNFAHVIENYYPEHVCYTDEPNKGQLRVAIIVKRERNVVDKPKVDDNGIKLMQSKTASFAPKMPEGAYENIDEEEAEEAQSRSKQSDYSVRRVKSKTASFEPVLPPVNLDNDENGFEDLGESDEPVNEMNWDTPTAPNQRDDEPAVPKYWHCYLCGKRKIYSGEPAETVTLRDGKVAYLCKKHRGKM